MIESPTDGRKLTSFDFSVNMSLRPIQLHECILALKSKDANFSTTSGQFYYTL